MSKFWKNQCRQADWPEFILLPWKQIFAKDGNNTETLITDLHFGPFTARNNDSILQTLHCSMLEKNFFKKKSDCYFNTFINIVLSLKSQW